MQDHFPRPDLDAELERVEGGFGATPREHFFGMREMVPDLVGLAMLDSDGRQRQEVDEGGLRITWWNRYEVENYFVTPDVLKEFVRRACADDPPLLERIEGGEADEVLDALILERVFPRRPRDFATWQGLDADAARLVWESSTGAVKLSDFAEEFFRRLADRLGRPMLLRKGELHRLVDLLRFGLPAHARPPGGPHHEAARLGMQLDLVRQVGQLEKCLGDPNPTGVPDPDDAGRRGHGYIVVTPRPAAEYRRGQRCGSTGG
ncbi:MAG: hypothetical protein OXH75_12170 [Acidobacteria bacterium]|nr:hypothetical protein [Acidobacteriota bacterium]